MAVMKFAVSKGETELAELTARIFDIKGRGATETAKRAEAALIKANPHLRDLTKVKEGTLIVIPELPESPPLRGSQTAGVGAELDDQVKLAVKELDDVIGRSAASEEQAAAADSEALKDRELREFAARSPESKEQLERIADAIKNKPKETKATAAAQKEALKR